MGPVPSQYVDQYQGLSVPVDSRLPWNPWFAKEFQFQENKNDKNWQPWNDSCFENRSNKNRQNSQLFVEPECFSLTVGSSGKIQTKPEVLGTDQSMNFQNTSNENRAKNFQNLPKDGFSRKMNRKNRKRNRPRKMSKQIAVDTTCNSPLESRQQSYQNWSHVPVLEWSKSNLTPILEEMRFQNITFRSRSFNESSKNPGRSHNSARSEFTERSISETASVTTTSRAYFNSDNYSNRSMGNAASSYAKFLSGAKMTRIGRQVNSATSSNSEIFKEDDDVMYLFSVDPSSEGKLCLEIDLQSDGVNLIPNSSSPKAQKTKDEDDQTIVVIDESDLNRPWNRKRKLSESNEMTSKRPSHRPRCMACKKSYDDVTAKKQNMFISSSCSHVFCGPCISEDEKSKVCTACEVKFIGFRRLYV